VHGSLQNLAHVDPLDEFMSAADWTEIARALVGCEMSKLGIADYGPLFLVSQLVLKRTLGL
jgi:hypothetical protein